MLVASDEATSGSVMQNAERISPSSRASSRSRHSCVRPSYAKSTAPPDGSGLNFTYPRVSTAVAGLRRAAPTAGAACARLARPVPARGAEEDVDTVRFVGQLIGHARIARVDEAGDVGRRLGVAAVVGIEHDVARGRVPGGADPVGGV